MGWWDKRRTLRPELQIWMRTSICGSVPALTEDSLFMPCSLRRSVLDSLISRIRTWVELLRRGWSGCGGHSGKTFTSGLRIPEMIVGRKKIGRRRKNDSPFHTVAHTNDSANQVARNPRSSRSSDTNKSSFLPMYGCSALLHLL